MVSFWFVILAAFLGGCFGSILTVAFYLDRRAGNAPSRTGTGDASPEASVRVKRAPVYQTPEKAAYAERARAVSVPPQWHRIIPEKRPEDSS